MINQKSDFVKCPKCAGNDTLETIDRKIGSHQLIILKCSNPDCQIFLGILPLVPIDYSGLIVKLNENISTVNNNLDSLNSNIVTVTENILKANNLKSPNLGPFKKMKYLVPLKTS